MNWRSNCLPEEDADKAPFDILDATKIWPEDQFPLQRVGKLTLNRNPDNFFAETEEVAFHPGHLVPGIDVSDDPLLQGRLFSYLDTQLNRFGTPNFVQLPINQPKSPVNNFNQDGIMRFTNRPGKANYEPNSLGGYRRACRKRRRGMSTIRRRYKARKVRERSKTFDDHYTQAALFFNSLTMPEQDHIAQALIFELGKVSDVKIQKRMLEHVAKVDAVVGGHRRRETRSAGAERASPRRERARRKGLSQEEGPKDSIKSRKIAVLAADGVTAGRYQTAGGGAKKEGATVEIIAPHLGELKGGIKVDKSLPTVELRHV